MKGFLSFALILAMAVVLLSFSANTTKNETQLENAKNELIIAEEANKERTLIENGFDRIVKAKLSEQITAGNYNVQIAQNEINGALEKYLYKKAYAADIIHYKKGDADKDYLNANSSVQIIKTEGFIYAEYSYTAGLMKNSTINKKSGKKIITYFEVPAGYLQKEIRAK